MQEFQIGLDTGACVPTAKEQIEAIELRLDTVDGRLDAVLGKAKKTFSWKRLGLLALKIIPSTFLILGFLWHVVGLEVDKRIDTKLVAAFAPVKDDLIQVHKDIQQVSGEIRELKGIVSVLQAPAIASKFSKLPKEQLKSRRDELKEIKSNLAAAPKDTPNLWPAGFQVITLLSQAMYQLETIGRQPLTTLDNMRIAGFGGPAGRGGVVNGRNVLLKNTIEGLAFENSVVHFDASTRLINVQFTHCVFIFPQDANPPQPLQQIGATLLASDLENVRITAG